jgi:hypothetical protein
MPYLPAETPQSVPDRLLGAMRAETASPAPGIGAVSTGTKRSGIYLESTLRKWEGPMTLRTVTVVLMLGGLFLIGCVKHYWQSPGHDVGEFRTDSAQCIQEAKGKYDTFSEQVYRRCMRARGWDRIETQYPTNRQFRGPEDEDDFRSPPDPLSARGVQPSTEQPVQPDVTLRPVPADPGAKPPGGPTLADCRAFGASRPEWREQCASILQFCRHAPPGSMTPEMRARCN